MRQMTAPHHQNITQMDTHNVNFQILNSFLPVKGGTKTDERPKQENREVQFLW